MCNTNTMTIVINLLLFVALITFSIYNIYELYKSIKFYKKLEQRHAKILEELDYLNSLKKEIKDKDETTI